MKISAKDSYLLEQYKWYKNTRGYWVCTNDSRLYLHRLIMGNPEGSVDHINGDQEDNRRENLRSCNQSQNCANSKISRNNTSGYKGVSWNRALKKWHAYIMVNRKRIHLGYFASKIRAARAYDKAATQYFGKFARLNGVKE